MGRSFRGLAGAGHNICQQSTRWSGLGAIDVLAGALDLSSEGRATLRTWYQRHTVYYRVLSLQKRGEETECIRMEALWNAADQGPSPARDAGRGLRRPCPSMRFPREFLDHAQGIGAFHNPDEGQEFMTRFHHVLSGLRKRGEDLLASERKALRHFVTE